MTDPLGQSQVLPYIKGLSKKGYSFHLVSFEKEDRFQKHKKHIQELCKEDNIEWHPENYSFQGGLKKTIRQVRKMKSVSRYLHDKHDFDIIHCRSYISALVGLELKKKTNTKFVFDMRGFWADERVEGGLWDLKKPVYRQIYNYFKRKELKFFKNADYTISLTDTGKDEIIALKGLKSGTSPIQVIPCCVDLNMFDAAKINPENQQELKSELGINPDAFILGYVGSIGTWYMLPEMLNYFRLLKAKNDKARFLFITGEDPKFLKQEAQKKGVNPNDLLIKSVLHNQVPLCISLFNESIFFIRPTFSKKASSPTKQGEIMAMGVPLVCNSGIGDTVNIVEKYNTGIVVHQFTEEAYEDALNQSRNFDHEAISAGAKDYFSLELGIERYEHVYKTILNESKL